MESDEVDRVVDAWARERPDLDLTPMYVMSRVSRLAQQLDRARSAAFSGHELTGWEFDVLAALRRIGKPYVLSPGRLLAETHVTSGTMTNRIDRLAARGLVSREPDPADRRGVRVALTEKGRVAVDGALVDLVRIEDQLLSGLAEEERQEVADLLRRLMLSFPRPTA
ncbi:MarR family winged helix-turn-helix transcriptional regulator [Naumannella halotolerans]|uniref:MarR family winged helix-turn-helix transcriptional regulator n=1 Tax=Naumannella halotolerans TaxID=993414 RepID=UPI00370DDB4A